MSLWKFGAEKFDAQNSSTTGAKYKAGGQPNPGIASSMNPLNNGGKKNKRNVIVTEKGWVRREHRQMNHIGAVGSTTRQIDTILVAAGGKATLPGSATAPYAGGMGFPNIAEVFLANTTNSDMPIINASYGGGGSAHQLVVVFNEPVKHAGNAGALKLTFANTAGGNNGLIATAVAGSSNTSIKGANNQVIFTFTPTVGDAGIYKIPTGAGAIINATSLAANLVSLNTGFRAANDSISSAVSNTVSSTGTFEIKALL
jgi:hypothetical protein